MKKIGRFKAFFASLGVLGVLQGKGRDSWRNRGRAHTLLVTARQILLTAM
jgi:hypothetical protein